MSVDYYLVCEEKKIIMPLFSMTLGTCWIADKRWLFDFILQAGNGMRLMSENDQELPDRHEESDGWKFLDAWREYKEPKLALFADSPSNTVPIPDKARGDR